MTQFFGGVFTLALWGGLVVYPGWKIYIVIGSWYGNILGYLWVLVIGTALWKISEAKSGIYNDKRKDGA
jgi:hypothetical protein